MTVICHVQRRALQSHSSMRWLSSQIHFGPSDGQLEEIMDRTLVIVYAVASLLNRHRVVERIVMPDSSVLHTSRPANMTKSETHWDLVSRRRRDERVISHPKC